MHRRIVIYGSTRDGIRDLITVLTGQDYQSNYSTTYMSPDLKETNSCRHGGNTCSFIEIPQDFRRDADKIHGEPYSRILKQLKDYIKSGIHLILFVTENGRLNSVICENLNHILSFIYPDKVAVACVVVGCDNRDIEGWKSENKKALSPFELSSEQIVGWQYGSNNSKSIGTIWKMIEEYSAPSDTLRYEDGNTNGNLVQLSPSGTVSPTKNNFPIATEKSKFLCTNDNNISKRLQ